VTIDDRLDDPDYNMLDLGSWNPGTRDISPPASPIRSEDCIAEGIYLEDSEL
jgi:hypothetical protein